MYDVRLLWQETAQFILLNRSENSADTAVKCHASDTVTPTVQNFRFTKHGTHATHISVRVALLGTNILAQD